MKLLKPKRPKRPTTYRELLAAKKKGKRTKYGSISCNCKAGHTHKSRAEVPFCDSLRMLLRAKKIKSFKYELGYDLHGLGGKKVARHYPDFTIIYPGDDVEIWEIKGFPTAVWMLKAALFKQEYGGILKYIVKKV